MTLILFERFDEREQTLTFMTLGAEEELVHRVERVVAQRLLGQQAGHGMDHVRRVFVNARQIQSQVGGNRLIVELAALLHDVGDAKFCAGVERSGEFAREILENQNVDREVIETIVWIVDNISFRKNAESSSLSLEAKIVQDADRLDAIGAIGIVRTIEYGAVKGQPFHLPGENRETSQSGIGHFYQKLFKLRAMLNTEPARQIAAERERFMQTFLEQYLSECGEQLKTRESCR